MSCSYITLNSHDRGTDLRSRSKSLSSFKSDDGLTEVGRPKKPQTEKIIWKEELNTGNGDLKEQKTNVSPLKMSWSHITLNSHDCCTDLRSRSKSLSSFRSSQSFSNCLDVLRSEDISTSQSIATSCTPNMSVKTDESDDGLTEVGRPKKPQTEKNIWKEELNTDDEQGKESVKENEEKDFFEETFLDSEYNIRKDVHEIFIGFSWLRGAYGVSGPNKKIPRPHLYLTVERGQDKSEVLNEIEKQFKCDPKKYFELLREPKRKPTFKYLSKPTAGGSIVAVNKPSAPKPLQISNEDEDEDEESGTTKASGTLTMFCSQKGNHYALTCFHVGCATDKQCFEQTFNLQQLLDIHTSIEYYKNYAREQQEYYYHEREIVNTDENENENANTLLGKVSKCCFHSESDIMSIEVNEGVQIDCLVEEIGNPDWVEISRELYERVVCNSGNPVKVLKVGYPPKEEHEGHIVKWNFSYKYGGKILFQNAIVVEGTSKTFLEDGDSGALICCLDNNQVKQAFAYGVCKVNQLYPEQTSSDEESDDDDGEISPNIYGVCEVDQLYPEQMSSDKESDDDDGEISSNIEATRATSSEECSAAPKVCGTEDGNVGDSDEEFVIFQKEGESFFICLKLKAALTNLNLLGAGCFSECGSIG